MPRESIFSLHYSNYNIPFPNILRIEIVSICNLYSVLLLEWLRTKSFCSASTFVFSSVFFIFFRIRDLRVVNFVCNKARNEEKLFQPFYYSIITHNYSKNATTAPHGGVGRQHYPWVVRPSLFCVATHDSHDAISLTVHISDKRFR